MNDMKIGLEIHVQLNTKSKLFCGCATQGNPKPNTRTCDVCLGMPGTKPVFNREALNFAIKLALALNCKVSNELIFSRKSYFYPDMAKNYQISQYELPLAKNGKLILDGNEIGITRVHIEEDPASLIHPKGILESKYVLVDYNRSGIPLVEIVTKPDISSPEEARSFMKELIRILNYLKIFDQNACIVKADVNVSVKESSYRRVEIKNVTGFKEIERAIFHEVDRQRQKVKEGKKIPYETRAWDTVSKITRSLRTKEVEEEYGYIFEPDLVKIELAELVNEIKKTIPELAREKVARLRKEYKLKPEDAEVISSEILLVELFEKVAKEVNPLLAAKWLRRELLRVLNYTKKDLQSLIINEKHIIELLKLIETKTITETTAQKLLEKLIEKPFSPREYVLKKKVKAIVDVKKIKRYCKEAIKQNPKAVDDYKKGKKESFNFLVGMVMKATKGKANPSVVNKIMKELIK